MGIESMTAALRKENSSYGGAEYNDTVVPFKKGLPIRAAYLRSRKIWVT
jgi:hypothetical protein